MMVLIVSMTGLEFNGLWWNAKDKNTLKLWEFEINHYQTCYLGIVHSYNWNSDPFFTWCYYLFLEIFSRNFLLFIPFFVVFILFALYFVLINGTFLLFCCRFILTEEIASLCAVNFPFLRTEYSEKCS